MTQSRNNQKASRKHSSGQPCVVVAAAPKVNARMLPLFPNRPPRPPRGPTFDFQRDGYLGTLVDPFGIHGVKIPDEITNPSGVITLRFRGTLNALQDSAIPGSYAQSIRFTPTIAQAFAVGSTFTSGNLTYGTNNDFPDAAVISGFARQYRTVSAGLAIQQTNAMSANQGRNLCAYFPGNDRFPVSVSGSVTAAGVLNAEIASDSPVNNQSVCNIKWHPTDTDNYRYHGILNASSGVVGSAGYTNPGQLLWFADGLAANATFEYLVVLNLEFLPSRNTFCITPILPSLYNVKAMERALNSPLAQTSFGVLNPDSIRQSDNSNAWSVSTSAGQLLTNFGGGVQSVLAPYMAKMGAALTMAGLGAMHRRLNNSVPMVAGLAGRPLPIQY